jgi:hypothetical protein
MNEYTFPFDTCETPNTNGIIAQPWSVLFDCISVVIIIYFLMKTKTNYSFALIVSILMFELFHVFSHIIHIAGKIQTYILHSLALLINLLYINTLYNHTKVFPRPWFLFYIVCILIVDIYALFNLPFIFYFFTQILTFISTVLYYNKLMPQYYQKTIPYIIISLIVIYLIFVNESFNCKYMLSVYPNFPFHIIIEILSIIPFYFILSVYHRL